MKFTYEKQDDVLMIWLSKEPIDYAEQNKNLIVHFSKKDKPVLMEILNATDFVKQSAQTLPMKIRKEIMA